MKTNPPIAKALRRTVRGRIIRTAKHGGASAAIGQLEPGCETYILTFGQFSLIHALTAILAQTGPADINIATWTAANACLEESARLMNSALIRSVRFVVDRSFLTRQPNYCARMRELFGDACIRTCRTHAKFMTIRNDHWSIAVRTSMNLNENPRLENLEISDDPTLCGFLCDIVDDIFAEHKEGEFNAQIPDLGSLENVHIPGLLRYGKATAASISASNPPTIGKPHD